MAKITKEQRNERAKITMQGMHTRNRQAGKPELPRFM